MRRLSLASPYGRGAPAGGGEGPLSHGRCRASSPKGGAKYILPNSPDVPKKETHCFRAVGDIRPYGRREVPLFIFKYPEGIPSLSIINYQLSIQ